MNLKLFKTKSFLNRFKPSYNLQKSLLNYLKVIIEFVVIALIVMIIVFFILHAIPGRENLVTARIQNPDDKKEIIKKLGLDDPIMKQFADYMRRFFTTGYLGSSLTLEPGTPVNEFLFSKFAVSFQVGIISFAIGLIAGIILGIIVGRKPNSITDNFATIFVAAGFAIPGFVFAIFFLLAAFKTGSPFQYDVDNPATLFLPALALAIPAIAGYVRYLRTSINEEIGSQYIRFARVKGCSRFRVLWKHSLKPSLFPVATFLPFAFIYSFVGAITIEKIFGVPGSGRLLVDAVLADDYDVVEAEIMVFTGIIILAFFLRDVLYRALDPRIRLG